MQWSISRKMNTWKSRRSRFVCVKFTLTKTSVNVTKAKVLLRWHKLIEIEYRRIPAIRWGFFVYGCLSVARTSSSRLIVKKQKTFYSLSPANGTFAPQKFNLQNYFLAFVFWP